MPETIDAGESVDIVVDVAVRYQDGVLDTEPDIEVALTTGGTGVVNPDETAAGLIDGCWLTQSGTEVCGCTSSCPWDLRAARGRRRCRPGRRFQLSPWPKQRA